MKIEGYVRHDFKKIIRYTPAQRHELSERQPKNKILRLPRVYQKPTTIIDARSQRRRFVKVSITIEQEI